MKTLFASDDGKPGIAQIKLLACGAGRADEHVVFEFGMALAAVHPWSIGRRSSLRQAESQGHFEPPLQSLLGVVDRVLPTFSDLGQSSKVAWFTRRRSSQALRSLDFETFRLRTLRPEPPRSAPFTAPPSLTQPTGRLTPTHPLWRSASGQMV